MIYICVMRYTYAHTGTINDKLTSQMITVTMGYNYADTGTRSHTMIRASRTYYSSNSNVLLPAARGTSTLHTCSLKSTSFLVV